MKASERPSELISSITQAKAYQELLTKERVSSAMLLGRKVSPSKEELMVDVKIQELSASLDLQLLPLDHSCRRDLHKELNDARRRLNEYLGA